MIKRAPRLIRAARRKAGITQRALAGRSGVPQPTIAAIEAGRQDPRFGTLDRLLRACGYELDIRHVLGEGVDRTLIHEMLRLTPGERVRRAGEEARAIAPFGRARRRT
ncbi:MAG: helix-turn-helix domain-containing protein [Chloroflexota bacterium]